MAERKRSSKSTVASQLDTFQKANDLPSPSRELSEREATHFKAIVTSREVSTWSDHDILIATNLSLIYGAIDDQWDDLRVHGWKVFSERGTPVKNPASDQLNQLSGSARAFATILGLSASQRGLAGSEQNSRNKAESGAREIIKKAAKNGLLA